MRKTILSLALSGILLSGWASDRALIADDYSNYFSTAKEIPLNTQISGSIETAGDIDIFKFTLNQDDGVNIYGESLNTSYTNVRLYFIKKETIETLSQYLNEENWDIRGDVESNIKNILFFSMPNEEYKESLNMDKGDYYIVAMPVYDTSTTPYTFRIESTENNGSVSLDQITLEYCKSHLSECGIEIDSSLKYTQSDLDSAVASAREDEKNQLKLSRDRIDSLGSGWNMLGTAQDMQDKTIFNSASSVWVYDNGSWDNNPNEIKAFSGFWIKK